MKLDKQLLAYIALVIIAGLMFAILTYFLLESMATHGRFDAQSAPTPNGSVILPISVTNLLQNPSLELPYFEQGKQEVLAPEGWRIIWDKEPYCDPDAPGCDIPCPLNCQKQTSAGVLSVSDGVITMLPQTVTLALNMPITVTFSAHVTSPVSAFDVTLFHNQAVISATGAVTHIGQLKSNPAYTRLEWKSDGWVQGNVDLFDITMTAIASETYHFELMYFIGTHRGGMYGVAWEPGLTTSQRVTETVTIADSVKCVNDYGCYWAEPECVPVLASIYPYRVMAGEAAQKCFAYLRMYRLWLYQQVAVNPLTLHSFDVYAQGWQCSDFNECDGGKLSNAPDETNFRVGVDRNGGIDPLANSVKWSTASQYFDIYGGLGITATSTGNTVTVFIEASPHITFARTTDSYLDNGGLFQVVTHRKYMPVIR